ncbi:MAG: hypothetical protein HY821_15540 [Acidobacteria bacterium]|nr:hypothetical protein [Acidobacteriota bacterium]
MKRTSLKCALAAAAAMAMALGVAAADLAAGTTRAMVPFEFVVNGRTMPAGEYLITAPNAAGIVSVRAAGSSAAALAVGYRMDGSARQGAPELVFVKKAGKLHLSQVVMPRAPGRVQLPTK